MPVAGPRKFVIDTNCFVDASRVDAEVAALAEFSDSKFRTATARVSGSESVRSNNIGSMNRPEELGMPLFLPEWLTFDIISPFFRHVRGRRQRDVSDIHHSPRGP